MLPPAKNTASISRAFTPAYAGISNPIIGYDIKRWFTIALSYDVWAEHPDSDGGRENPFYNENSRLIIGLTFRTDGLYASVRDKRIESAASGTGVEEL